MDILEKDEQALAAFQRGQAFVVAAYLVEPHLERIQPLVRKTLTVRRVMAGDFPAKAYLFPKTLVDGRVTRDVLFGADDASGPLGRLDAVDVVPATLKGCTVPMVIGTEAKTEMNYKDDKDVDDEDKLKRSNAATWLHRSVQRFSRITGERVKLHFDGHGTRSPKPDEPGTIHLFTGADPPGEQNGYAQRTHLFGVQLTDQMLYMHFRSGARGRGTLLSTQESAGTETRFAQILGRNVYLLFPVISVFWPPNTVTVFEKALGKAYQALLDGAEDAEAEALKAPPPDDKAFLDAVSDAVTWTADHWKKKVEEQTEHVEQVRKALHDAYGILRQHKVRLETCSRKSFYTDTLERMPKDRARILALPGVERLAAIKGGIVAYTKPLDLEWDGKRYPVGRFALRVGKYGGIAVWGVESTHPDGVPHPHIAKDGGPCYGNASDAITQAAADFRVADVIEHLLTWLTRGYTPDLARNKIEEWAPMPEKGETPCRSTTRSNGRSSTRTRLDRRPSSA